MNQIQILNDQFRQSFLGGTIVLTEGIKELAEEDKSAVLEMIQNFKTWNKGNDPYGEHDFGSVVYKDIKVFWKIDYYDKILLFRSDDPGDPQVTERVLMVMLAEEY